MFETWVLLAISEKVVKVSVPCGKIRKISICRKNAVCCKLNKEMNVLSHNA